MNLSSPSIGGGGLYKIWIFDMKKIGLPVTIYILLIKGNKIVL